MAAENKIPCPDCGASRPLAVGPCLRCGASLDADAIPTVAFDPAGATTVVVPRRSELRPGAVYAERFRVARVLGSGGMGSVYLVDEIETRRVLALKILRPDLRTEATAVSRFLREVEVLAQIDHPSIPKVYEWGQEGDELFFLAEFVSGKNLRDLMNERVPWPAAEAVDLVATVAGALHAAHEQKIVHRDVKPHNIMLTPAGATYLIDFGVARTAAPGMETLTATGAIVGTPCYMSPEQIDSHRVDERSDIYSLGIVFYELLTGDVPFVGDTPMSVATKHLRDVPRRPRTIRPEIPHWVEKIVLRCLEKDPAARFWTARELIAELRKKRPPAAVKKRTFENGDVVAEDELGATEWALAVTSPVAKDGWVPNLAVRYRESFFRLAEVASPADGKGQSYYFEPWPENEVLRRVVDYRPETEAKPSLAGKIKRWIGG